MRENQITFRCSRELYELLEKVAKELEATKSTLIRDILERYKFRLEEMFEEPIL